MDPSTFLAIIVIAAALLAVITVVKMVKIVPQQVEYVVERLASTAAP